MKQEPKLPALPNIDADVVQMLDAAVRDINSLPENRTKPPREVAVFVNLSKQAGDGLVEAARSVCLEAENFLKEAEQYRDHLHSEISKREQQLHDLTERVKEFGRSILDANKKFHTPGDST